MDGTALTTWLIRPHDPLIFRDGKPFAATPGARAASLPFPHPSTLAGAVRTRSGAQANGGAFPTGKEDVDVIQRVLGYQVVGPFLFDTEQNETLFPAPQDALLLRLEPHDDTKAQRVPLKPTTRFQDVLTYLPEGLQEELQLVAPVTQAKAKAKPHPGAPAFWRWSQMEAWLKAPQADEVTLADLGLGRLPVDVRVHVSIEPGRDTAKEHALFQTGGLTFVRVTRRNEDGDEKREMGELGLLVQTDAPLKAGWDTLGGERRVVAWEPAPLGVLPACPPDVQQAILQERRGRLILATPAHFKQGFLPAWVCEHPSGVKLRIVGAAVGRPVHVSGWDYKEHSPKPSRRLVPAGSVYFFEILAGDDAAVSRFIQEVWLHAISDDEQDRRDGFGVALLGAWHDKED